MSVLSVDLGTSNTVAVLAAHGRPPRVVEVEGSATMPSAVFAADDGRLVVGREAERRARLDPARFEPNPKRRVDEGTLLLGDRVVPVSEAFAAVLGKVAEETSRQLGGARADEVRLTHPAQWGPVRRNVLLSAARQASLGSNLVLVPEPVAAAAHFASFPGRTLAPGQALAVYDLGAGTFDVAIVGATQNGFAVLAEAGLPDLGGLDVDQALLAHVGRQVSHLDPHMWQRLMMPQSTSDRRAQRALREDVRAAKEALSGHPQTDMPLPDPFHDVLVTRAELESLIRPNLVRSAELLATTVRSAGLSPDRLAGVYLVGGSSRIPLVATLIAEQLRIVPTNLDQPETAVALGAHHVPQAGTSLRTEGLVGDASEERTTHIASLPPIAQYRRSMAPSPGVQQQPAPITSPFEPRQGVAGAPPNIARSAASPALSARNSKKTLIWLAAVAGLVVVGLVAGILMWNSRESGRNAAPNTTTKRSSSSDVTPSPAGDPAVTLKEPKRVDSSTQCQGLITATDISNATGMAFELSPSSGGGAGSNSKRCVFATYSPSRDYLGTVGVGFSDAQTSVFAEDDSYEPIDIAENTAFEDGTEINCATWVALGPAGGNPPMTYYFSAEALFSDQDSCLVARDVAEFVFGKLPNA